MPKPIEIKLTADEIRVYRELMKLRGKECGGFVRVGNHFKRLTTS